MEPDRIGWIDIAKGIGILLVMLGHLDPPGMTYLIYAFHVPLFFWISGMIFNHKRYEDNKILVRKKFRSLMVPYLVIAVVSYGLWASRKWQERASVNYLFYILYGNGNFGIHDFNAALWFLPSLFLIEIVFGWATTKFKKPVWVTGLAVSGLAGYILARGATGVKLPLGAEVALTGMVFFGMGHLLKSVRLKLWEVVALMGIFFIAARANFVWMGTKVDLLINRLGNFGWFYAAAIAGTLVCLQLARGINKNRVLEWLGRNSLIIFAWHQAIFMYLDIYVRPLIKPSGFQFAILTAIYIPTTVAVIMLGNRFIKKLKFGGQI